MTVVNLTMLGQTEKNLYCSKFHKIGDGYHKIGVMFQQLQLIDIKDGPMNLATSKINFLRQ